MIAAPVSRWLLNTFPTWLLAIVVVGGIAALAAAGQYAVRRRWTHTADGEHNDVAGVALGLIGAVYGIVLAFVIVALYEQFQDADANVREEATEVSQIYRVSRAFPLAVADEIRGELVDYVETVVGPEWKLMAEGEFSARAWQDVDALYETFQAYEPQTERESAFYGEAVSKLDELVAARRQRLHAAEESLPVPFQVMIIGGALVLIGFMYFVGLASARVQMTMTVGVAALIAFNLLLIVLLDHPFSGGVGVSDRAFHEGALAHLVRE
jgi:hypothetical protein